MFNTDEYYNEEAEKYFTLAIGEEWIGDDMFDDYC